MRISKSLPSAAHQEFMADIKAAMAKHPDLSAMEMLALASQLVGNLVALQDQRAMTPAQAMEVVAQNIEEGNKVAIETCLGDTLGNG